MCSKHIHQFASHMSGAGCAAVYFDTTENECFHQCTIQTYRKPSNYLRIMKPTCEWHAGHRPWLYVGLMHTTGLVWAIHFCGRKNNSALACLASQPIYSVWVRCWYTVTYERWMETIMTEWNSDSTHSRKAHECLPANVCQIWNDTRKSWCGVK